MPERAYETGASERTLYRRIAAFRDGGMESLLGIPKAKRRVLAPAIPGKTVNFKAKHPPLNLVEYGGWTLSRYGVSLSRVAKLGAVTNPRLLSTPYRTTQPKLFALDALG